MRDQHRDKRDLVNEVTDLRKQVADLKQAATERRRVEDGLRNDRELLRTLLDQTPHPLCLLSRAGAPLLANHAFVELLGYGSVGELVRMAGELGLFSEQAVLDFAPAPPRDLTFRRSDGVGLVLPAIASAVAGTEYLSIAVVTSPQPA